VLGRNSFAEYWGSEEEFGSFGKSGAWRSVIARCRLS
jgi:hypothetical protein